MVLFLTVFRDSTVWLTEQWTRFSWGVFYWLADPWSVVLPLLPLVILPLLVRKSIWQRWLSRPVARLLALYLVAISPPVASLMVQGLVYFVPADSGAQADAIIVLSRGEDVESSRYDLAIQLWQRDRAPRLFVTAPTNVTRMRKLLKAKGISTQVVAGTGCALTTRDEAMSTAAILGPEGVKTIILITDPPHMLRAFLTFRSLGFSVIPHMISLPPDLSSAKEFLLALREYLGLVSYKVLGRFNRHSTTELKQPPPEVLQVVQNRGCKIEATGAGL